MSDVYVSVDIESSGPFIGTHSMLQIGACIVGNVQQTFTRLLVPISDHVEEQAMKIVAKPLNYFFENGIDPVRVMAEFSDWVRSITGDGNPIFVGFNAAFDWGFVNWYFLKYGSGPNPFGYAPLDIKAYYAGLTGCSWDDTRSSRIQERFKTGEPHTHDALDDAIEQAEMFRLMLESR